MLSFFRTATFAKKKLGCCNMTRGMDSKPKEIKRLCSEVNSIFDHYLKGALPPKWMTQGIPANLKGMNLAMNWMTWGNAERVAVSVKEKIYSLKAIKAYNHFKTV